MAGTGNNQGVNTTGGYVNPPAGTLVPIFNCGIASYNLTGTTGAVANTGTVMTAVNIPAPTPNGFSPDTELIVRFQWGCSSSANTKTLTGLFNGTTVFTDVQTTNTANQGEFRIQCRNNTQVQIAGASPYPNSTTFMSAPTINMNSFEVNFTFWGTLANVTDNMRIESVSVWMAVPQVQISNRLFYGQKVFWGSNCHDVDMTAGGGSVTGAQLVNCMNALNMTVMRVAWEGPQSANALVQVAQALQGTGKQMYVCIDLGLDTTFTEQQCFTQGWTTALFVVNLLKPYGVTMYECGNEMDTKNGINISGGNGYFPSEFSPTLWPKQRGLIAGAVAAVQYMGCLAASNATTVCGIGFLKMLWNGTNPDGSGGAMKVQWDITAFHNYRPYGPLVAVQVFGGGQWINVYEELYRLFNRPIVISEYNGDAAFTEAQNAVWNTRVQNEMYSLRYKYNIMGCLCYQMFEGDPWGMVATASTATLSNPLGTTMAANCASLVDTGN